MSEKSTIIKDETVKNQIESTEADAGSAGISVDADASNIVPFSSEAPASPYDIQQGYDISGKSTEPLEESPLAAKEQEAPRVAPSHQPAPSAGSSDSTEKTFQKSASHVNSKEYEELTLEDAPAKKRFHFKKDDKEFFRDKWILSRIGEEQLMEYLTLEQRRNELQQQAKDVKEKRIFRAFEIAAALAAIVAVIYLLKDNPTILVNILYIAGISAAFWIWKNPKDKK